MRRLPDSARQEPLDALETVEGTVAELIFRNDENGYTVLTLDDADETTVVGTLPFLAVGEPVRLTGRWSEHPDYGRQFAATAYTQMTPQTPEAVYQYLSGGLVSGVGPVLARRLIDRFGKDTLEILQHQPQETAQVKGISQAKAENIAAQLREKRDFRDLMLFLYPLGIGSGKALRIYRHYGRQARQRILDDPYRLADEVFGIGFLTADRLAMELGLDPQAPQRLKSALLYVLTQAAGQGHTLLPESVWVQQAQTLIQARIDLSDPVLRRLLEQADLVLGNRADASPFAALEGLYRAEQEAAQRLLFLLQGRPRKAAQLCQLPAAETAIEAASRTQQITVSEQQRDALKLVLGQTVSILTGGPGTGKTTLLKLLCDCLEAQQARILLAAPTGRAAKRLSEATGRPAKTLHRLLSLTVDQTGSVHGSLASVAAPLEADLVVVDEASMIDALLFNTLVQRVPPGCRLLLVGDADQLPSVGAGDVLRDLIRSGQVPTTRLTQVFRQSDESLIIHNAHRIHQGIRPRLDQSKDSPFLFIPKEQADAVAQAVVRLMKQVLPEQYGLDPVRDVFVLTPTRKGPAGTQQLNQKLQALLFPDSHTREGLKAHGSFFGVGDRVMQTRNNYDLIASTKEGKEAGVFNGETGTVHAVDEASALLHVLFDDDRLVPYDRAALEDLELAYAMTVHKSQGSEYPVVVLALSPGPPQLLTRNLLYTAVTRARDKLLLVSSRPVLDRMLANRSSLERWTMLAEALQQGRAG